jgi:hypothetical protein
MIITSTRLDTLRTLRRVLMLTILGDEGGGEMTVKPTWTAATNTRHSECSARGLAEKDARIADLDQHGIAPFASATGELYVSGATKEEAVASMAAGLGSDE